jgi:hypothetical protein
VKRRAEYLSLAVAFTRVEPPGVCDMETRDTYLETKSQHDDAHARELGARSGTHAHANGVWINKRTFQ